MSTYYKYLKGNGVSIFGHGVWNLPDGDNPGEWMPEIQGELVECQNGYHACCPKDLPYWRGETLYELEYDGEVLETDQKVVGRKARLLRHLENWNSTTQRLYAADCAERVLPIFENEYPGDSRPREAIEAARSFDQGDVNKEDLRVARPDASASAYAADAAHCAGYAAAADAAHAAAYAAAYATAAYAAAAYAAAAASAYAAADTSAYAAAADGAARKQERDWQAKRLLAYIRGEVS